ncbi:ABC transporter permease [Jatrophihabitans cynanchi]|uniref:ABC transporter permease n=1 Tax=Jatrophihabitans cynanchi TaxID=2944128 RepID=A0ABY7K5D4_9ACTN|nr:ABC transporter permease [Jatrophihabitans sp. SB3-54]WAX59175.1 ABC transporter permease [Jatrophihabitans sp. SB3-54]
MTVIVLPATSTPRLVGNETLKGLQLAWRRRALLTTFVLMNGITFLGIRLLIGGGHIVTPLLAVTLPALLAYAVAQTAAMQGSGGIAEEINGGTLAQSQLCPASPQRQVLGRLTALTVEGLATAVPLALVFTLGYGVHYRLRPDVLVPAALTVLDGLGYALLIIALTVRVVSIGAITHVFGMVIQFFAGSFVPITVFPHALQFAVKFVPTTLGVQALNTTLAGRGLSAAWANGTVPWLIVHAAVSLTLGWALYARTMRRARREGGL